MKRSEINKLIKAAVACFSAHGWVLPAKPRWDVTDFGLGDWKRHGLVLVNLAEEPEYCEKLMYARRGMTTPAHCHHRKKEDIVSRWGTLQATVWAGVPGSKEGNSEVLLKINGEKKMAPPASKIVLNPGERITLMPGVYHEFCPLSEECIIGEISTANDDLHDNFFVSPDIGRFPGVEEDEPALVQLVSERRETA